MKTILCSGIVALSMLLSRPAFASDGCAEDPLKESISELISKQTPFSEFDLEGYVTVTFLVDDTGLIHVKQIASGNIFLADHVYDTLQNQSVECDCIETGKLYTMRLQYVQYS